MHRRAWRCELVGARESQKEECEWSDPTVLPRSLFSAATLFGVAACSDSTGAGTGTVSVRLTNASVASPVSADLVATESGSPLPAGSVKSVDIFVVRIDAKAKEPTDDEAAEATEESESEKGRMGHGCRAEHELRPDEARGRDEHVPWRRAGCAGSYKGFRLIIDPAKSSVTLNDERTP